MAPAAWISGTVVAGDGRGRTLGFPTANLRVRTPHQLPAEGIYAVRVRLAQDTVVHPGVMHIGPRPTFNQMAPVVEVHLLNFPDRSLYGTELMVQCVHYVRGVQRFSTPDALVQAMRQDAATAQTILAAQPQP